MARSTTFLAAAAAALLLAAPALAKTDYDGCIVTTVILDPGRHYTVWYLEDTGEICQGVDCGGGRAPPKTVPGCPAYSGTETVTPRFWTGWSAAHGPAATTSSTAPPLVEVTATTPATLPGAAETTGVEGDGPAVTTSAEGAGGGEETVGRGEESTVTTLPASVETGAGTGSGSGPETSGSGSDEDVTTTLSTGAAVPTAVGRGMLGVVAGVAAAGLVLA